MLVYQKRLFSGSRYSIVRSKVCQPQRPSYSEPPSLASEFSRSIDPAHRPIRNIADVGAGAAATLEAVLILYKRLVPAVVNLRGAIVSLRAGSVLLDVVLAQTGIYISGGAVGAVLDHLVDLAVWTWRCHAAVRCSCDAEIRFVLVAGSGASPRLHEARIEVGVAGRNCVVR